MTIIFESNIRPMKRRLGAESGHPTWPRRRGDDCEPITAGEIELVEPSHDEGTVDGAPRSLLDPLRKSWGTGYDGSSYDPGHELTALKGTHCLACGNYAAIEPGGIDVSRATCICSAAFCRLTTGSAATTH